MAPNSTTSPVHQLSPLDHLSPRSHVPKLLYFSTCVEPDRLELILRAGLERSLIDLSLLAGSVTLVKDDNVQTGTLAVQEPYYTANDILSFTDLRKKYSFDDLRRREFPTDAVAAEDVTPDATNNSTRVMLARVSFIAGGIIIAAAIHHCVMDESGIFAVMRLWSSHCCAADSNEPNSGHANGAGTSFVNSEWTNRNQLMAGVGTGRLQDHPEYKLRAPEDSATKQSAPTEYVSESAESTESAVLFFSDADLTRLKTAVGELVEKTGDLASWVSTNDALCALIWSSVTAARVADNAESSQPYTLFAMAVDGRAKLCPPMPPAYTGNVILISKAVDSFENLAKIAGEPQGVARAAQLIRASVQAIDDVMIRDIIAMVLGVDDIGRLCPGGYSSFQRNLGCSSWSRQDYYGLDWGQALGRCKRLRWRKLRSDGLFVIFPRIPAGFGSEYGPGGLEVCLALNKGAMHQLRKNEFFGTYAHWRCN